MAALLAFWFRNTVGGLRTELTSTDLACLNELLRFRVHAQKAGMLWRYGCGILSAVLSSLHDAELQDQDADKGFWPDTVTGDRSRVAIIDYEEMPWSEADTEQDILEDEDRCPLRSPAPTLEQSVE